MPSKPKVTLVLKYAQNGRQDTFYFYQILIGVMIRVHCAHKDNVEHFLTKGVYLKSIDRRVQYTLTLCEKVVGDI